MVVDAVDQLAAEESAQPAEEAVNKARRADGTAVRIQRTFLFFGVERIAVREQLTAGCGESKSMVSTARLGETILAAWKPLKRVFRL